MSVRVRRVALAVLLLTALAAAPSARALEVVTVRPVNHSLAVARDAAVLVLFDGEIDPATVDETSFAVFGRFTGPVEGTYQVAGARMRFVPVAPLAAGDQMTVRLQASLAGTDGVALGRTWVWNYWTASAPAGLVFTETAQLEPGNVPYGAHGGDLDDDGDLDLAVPNEGTDDMAVYLNDGSGVFAGPVSYPAGNTPSPIEAWDLNGDRIVDLVVANLFSDDLSVFLGVGDGTFEPEVRYPAGGGPRGVGFIDLDGDGDLEVLSSNRDSGDLSVYHSRGDGSFDPERRVDTPGSRETAVVGTDATGDGREDLIVGYYGSTEVRIFARTADGRFEATGQAASGGQVWQMAVGDLNGDGLVDVVTANSSANTAGVLLATAPGVLADAVTYPTDGFPIAIDLGDLDGDGDLDLVTSNFTGGTWTIYLNDGAGNFGDRRELPAIASGSCAVLHDRDGDGDLDITGIDENADRVLLLRNDD